MACPTGHRTRSLRLSSPGGSLADRMKEGRIPRETALSWLADAASTSRSPPPPAHPPVEVVADDEDEEQESFTLRSAAT